MKVQGRRRLWRWRWAELNGGAVRFGYWVAWCAGGCVGAPVRFALLQVAATSEEQTGVIDAYCDRGMAHMIQVQMKHQLDPGRRLSTPVGRRLRLLTLSAARLRVRVVVLIADEVSKAR